MPPSPPVAMWFLYNTHFTEVTCPKYMRSYVSSSRTDLERHLKDHRGLLTAAPPILSPTIIIQDLDADTQETRALPESDPQGELSSMSIWHKMCAPAWSLVSAPQDFACPNLD
ncbi:hypothetical protein GLOTRDRAFT_132732 [Gloeophyllum trabeum ATCC 11539]|uniref:Uncharacterized protein n=1 Tax=Gloeophyllum trabeum (strain ATCC 11539 / FP-39264 / Madison 617) TaxID=670483 RepID=S7PWJ3_GLOTA|nr:uncharacterized protein GLOTRDRAFT_132732 [Gloeophyllum trabeum ATCC 11539]EPQ51923.1 hypothetical protein GLOTRDRAFT_132732 [Gloeophyllum trabeum ATCC 11539]